MNNIWDTIIFNNTIRDWAISFSIILTSLVLLRFFQSIIIRKIKSISARTTTTVDDFIIQAVQSSGMPLLYVLAFYVGLKYIKMPAKASQIIYIALLLVITFFLLRIITSFIGFIFRQALAGKEKNRQREKQAKGILLIVQTIFWVLGFLFLIDNLGYDITTLVAGLGIGGIAIALAAQTILGDLFSYLVIFFDKPFEIGDFIVVQDKMGTVEYIGIKTTRIRTLGGEQLVCSNTDLTNSRVHNFKRMEERRVVFTFGLVYHTPVAKLKVIPQLVRKIIEGIEYTRFDRAHFLTFGKSSLDFEVVYYVVTPDGNLYMDIQQKINLEILALFAQEEIQFALTSQLAPAVAK
jgi:small-conductance mechanosensitive channel